MVGGETAVRNMHLTSKDIKSSSRSKFIPNENIIESPVISSTKIYRNKEPVENKSVSRT